MSLYAKIDCALDANPKIRKAGRLGREVFLFLLRRNRLLDANGQLPIVNIDPAYLADQLMMPQDEAAAGVSAAVTAALLFVTSEFVQILGWGEEWSRHPKSNAERQAEFRRKHKETNSIPDTPKHTVTKSNGAKVTSNGSNAREEKKRAEKNIGGVGANAALSRAQPDKPAFRSHPFSPGLDLPSPELPNSREVREILNAREGGPPADGRDGALAGAKSGFAPESRQGGVSRQAPSEMPPGQVNPNLAKTGGQCVQAVEAEPGAKPAKRQAKAPKEPKPARAPRKAVCDLPPDWQPNESHFELAKARAVDIAEEAAKLRDWAAAKGERKADWDATFRNWLRGAKPAAKPINGHAQAMGPMDVMLKRIKDREERERNCV